MTLDFVSVPSAWDLVTDYDYAEDLKNLKIPEFFRNRFRIWSYLFISLPGIIFVLSQLHRCLDECFSCRRALWLGRVVANTMTIVVVLIITGVVIYTHMVPGNIPVLVTKVMAILVGSVVLGVKVVGVLVHTENIKILNVRATAYEGSFEASLQLFLILTIWFSGHTPNLDIPAMSSSLLMIAKSGAESFLTFGEENNLREMSIMGQLKQMAKLMPVFFLTGTFRVTVLSITPPWDGALFGIILLPSALLLPMLVHLLIKRCGNLQQHTVADIVQCTGSCW